MESYFETDFDVRQANQDVLHLSDNHQTRSEIILPSRAEPESTSILMATSRMAKTRKVAEACHNCRKRKVRCTVLNHGASCAQCRMSGTECVFSKKTTRERLTQSQLASRRTAYYEARSSPNAHPSHHMMERTPTRPYQIRYHPGGNNPPIYQSPEEQRTAENSVRVAEARVATSLYVGSIIHNHSPVFPVSVCSDSASIARDRFTPHPVASFYSPAYLAVPSYFYSVPKRIGEKDLEYLRKEGVFSLPGTRLRNQLLKAYIDYVHGYIPVLGLNDFLSIIHSEDTGGKKLSLLLFNAVMFAGSTCIKLKCLQEAGFATRKQARRHFWQKTRLLYDFDYESDQICLIQSLLLMTFWYESSSQSKGARYWLSIAVDLTLTIGLNNNSVLQKMHPKQQKLCRRIWWSCFTRDKLVALGARQPAFIGQDYNVPALILEDFEIRDLSECMPAISEGCIAAHDPHVQKQVAVLFIVKVELCVCISNILDARYRNSNMPVHRGSIRQNQTTIITQTFIDGHERYDVELGSWLLNLPPAATYHLPMELSDCSETVVVHLSLLHMLYHSTISTLHRPWETHSSRSKVRSAAHSITGILENLHCLGLVCCVPIMSLTFIASALTIHLVDQNSSDEEIRYSAMEGFAKYMRIVRELCDEQGAEDEDEEEVSQPCFASPGLEQPATLSSIATSRNQSGNKVVQALNVRPLDEFNSIIEDTNALLPPDLQFVRQPQDSFGTQYVQSPEPQESLSLPEFIDPCNILKDDSGIADLELPLDSPFRPDYKEFLEAELF